jgi:hypothetical protein
MKKIIDKLKQAALMSSAALGRTDYDRWEKNATATPPWDERNIILARHIPAGNSVLDLGAGAQTLRKLLPQCTYVPCDLVQSTPDCIVCDFNKDIYPPADLRFDIVVGSGVMEYLREPLVFLTKIKTYAPLILLSYQPLTKTFDKMARLKWGFVNHLTLPELEALLTKAGYRFAQIGAWEGQLIFRLTHG